MRMKSVLLGSAAALGFGGAAQAADLAAPYEAEPVDYVRVCDAFGTGYYYIPGTDTCLKISGFVRFETIFYSDDVAVESDETDDRFGVADTSHYDGYEFHTRAGLTVEARSQTDWGPLVGVLNLEGNFFGVDETQTAAFVDDALISLGPLYAGFTQSLFDQIGGGYVFDGIDGLSDDKLNTIGVNWAFNGFGVALALEDNRYRADSWYDGDSSLAGDFPDLAAALFGEWGNIGAALSFLYMDTENTYGVQGYVEAANIGIFDFLAGAAYMDGDTGDLFYVLASLQANWTSNLSSAVAVRWDECGGLGCSTDTWEVAFDTVYRPVTNMMIGGEVKYDDASDSWLGLVRLQRDFGN